MSNLWLNAQLQRGTAAGLLDCQIVLQPVHTLEPAQKNHTIIKGRVTSEQQLHNCYLLLSLTNLLI